MIKDVGCNWVILGHSERRNIFKESDEVRLNDSQNLNGLDTDVHVCFRSWQLNNETMLDEN